MKIGVCLLGLISNINSIQQYFTEIAYCNFNVGVLMYFRHVYLKI